MICNDCQQSTSGKCWKHQALPVPPGDSNVTEAAAPVYGWKCPSCGRVWAWWYAGWCVCWKQRTEAASAITPADAVWK